MRETPHFNAVFLYTKCGYLVIPTVVVPLDSRGHLMAYSL